MSPSSAPVVLLDGASMWFRSFFGVPSSITALFQGTLLFLLFTADVLINYRLRYVSTAPAAREVAS